MDLGLENKIVVVAGASKGIGFACAEAFAREDAAFETRHHFWKF